MHLDELYCGGGNAYVNIKRLKQCRIDFSPYEQAPSLNHGELVAH